MSDIELLLQAAVTARAALFDEPHRAAFRLFNGFLEGCPDLVIDLYGRTALIHNYAKPAAAGEPLVTAAHGFLQEHFAWLEAVVVKTRHSGQAEEKNGRLLMGTKPDHWISEFEVRYAVDMLMNRDASFYLDTRNLRRWLLDRCAGQTVLNTFAYTGSLGVAAQAAGAKQVIQTDLNKKFLNVAKTSYTLNGFPIDKKNFVTGDFWSVTKRFNREKMLFDTVILDPPFFSKTAKGRVDLAQNVVRLVNKLRPLVRHNGRIVVINNALFVSGSAYIEALQALCHDGYVSLEESIPIGEDFVGYPETRRGELVTDVVPFNHTTKIAVLRISHKGR